MEETSGYSREQEERLLAFTRSFLVDAVGRGELSPDDFARLTSRIDDRLFELRDSGGMSSVPAFLEQRRPEGGVPRIARREPRVGPIEHAVAAGRPRVSGRQLGLTWLLYLGAFFLLLAAFAFTAFGWQSFSDEIKFAVIGLYTALLFGISVVAERAKLAQAGYTFFWLATATVPIALGAFAAFILDLRMGGDALPVGNEWLAFVLLGSGVVAFGLYRWKQLAGLRYVSLLAVSLSPVAYFVETAEYLPAIPSLMALAQVAAVRRLKRKDWAMPAVVAAAVSAALGIILSIAPVLEHLAREVSRMQGVDPFGFFEGTTRSAPEAAVLVSVASLTGAVWLWRRWRDMPEARALEAFGASVLVVLLFTGWGLGTLGQGAGLLYLGMLGVSAAYVVFGRSMEALTAAAPAAVMLMALTPRGVYERAFLAARSPFDSDELLASFAILALGALYWRGAEIAEEHRKWRMQGISLFLVPGAYLLLTACLPVGVPAVALIVTAGCGVLAVLGTRESWPLWQASAAAGAAVSWMAVAIWTVEKGETAGAEPGWPLTVLYGLILISMLGISREKGFSERSSLLVLLPGYLLVAQTGAWAQLGDPAVLAMFAAITLAWAVLYRLDFYLVTAVGISSMAAVAWIDDVWPVSSTGNIDPGVAALVFLPAPLLAMTIWRDAKGPGRGLLRSIACFAVPLLVLGAARLTDWDQEFVLFILVLIGGSAFAVAGFMWRIAGFASVGLLFAFWAAFEFLVPFIRRIPSWVGFGMVGLLLVVAGILLERNREFLKEKAGDLSGGWV